MSLNIQQNRKEEKYTTRHQLSRILWVFGQFCFKFSPRTCFGYRNSILRLFGAKIGENVNIYSSVKIYFPWQFEIGDWSSIGEGTLIYNLGRISIGEKTTISHKSHICAGTHDYSLSTLPLIKPSITIKNQVWIAAESFIGPGVTINNGAIIGARGVVFKDVEAWTIVGGNPAKFIKQRVIEE